MRESGGMRAPRVSERGSGGHRGGAWLRRLNRVTGQSDKVPSVINVQQRYRASGILSFRLARAEHRDNRPPRRAAPLVPLTQPAACAPRNCRHPVIVESNVKSLKTNRAEQRQSVRTLRIEHLVDRLVMHCRRGEILRVREGQTTDMRLLHRSKQWVRAVCSFGQRTAAGGDAIGARYL